MLERFFKLNAVSAALLAVACTGLAVLLTTDGSESKFGQAAPAPIVANPNLVGDPQGATSTTGAPAQTGQVPLQRTGDESDRPIVVNSGRGVANQPSGRDRHIRVRNRGNSRSRSRLIWHKRERGNVTEPTGPTSTPVVPGSLSDRRAPVVIITSLGAGDYVNARSVVVAPVSDEPATIECKLDDGGFNECSKPRTFGSLAEGSHTVVVTATDAGGNVGTNSLSFVVDTRPPDTILDEKPASVTSDPTPQFTFHATQPESVFECKLDDGEIFACEPPLVTDELVDGLHTFYVRAIDIAGNTDPTYITYDFTVATSRPVEPTPPVGPTEPVEPTTPVGPTGTVDPTPPIGPTPPVVPPRDTIAPDTVIDTRPPNPTSDNTPTITFHSNEAGATFACKTGTGAFVACSSPFTTTTLVDGNQALAVRAVDAAGNVDQTPASYSFKVDTRRPVAKIASPDDGAEIASGTAAVAFSADEPASFTCKFDGGDFAGCASPKIYQGIAEGRHEIVVRAIDAAGNFGEAAVSITRSPTDGGSSSSGGGLTAVALDSSHVRLSWTPPALWSSADVLRDGEKIAEVRVPAVAFKDAQLWFSSAYTYSVKFKAASGSTLSTIGPVSMRTPGLPAAGFPVEFPNSPYFARALPAAPKIQSRSATFVNYVAGRSQNANLTLRKYGVPVFESHSTDATKTNFACTYTICSINDHGPVPSPFNVFFDPGTDQHMVIVDRDSGRAYDFYKPWIDAPGAWHNQTSADARGRCANGATACPYTKAGVVVDLSGDGTMPASWAGADAANIPLLAGLIRPEEIAQGRIDHALMLGVPGIAPGEPACPATANVATTSDTNSVVEGTLFQLDPALDLSQLKLPKWQTIIAQALQKYGAYVRDNSGTLTVYGESSSESLGGRNYDGWVKTAIDELASGDSAAFSGSFPWNKLRALQPPC